MYISVGRIVVLIDYWWSGFDSIAGILVLEDYPHSGFGSIGGVLVLVVWVVYWC